MLMWLVKAMHDETIHGQVSIKWVSYQAAHVGTCPHVFTRHVMNDCHTASWLDCLTWSRPWALLCVVCMPLMPQLDFAALLACTLASVSGAELRFAAFAATATLLDPGMQPASPNAGGSAA